MTLKKLKAKQIASLVYLLVCLLVLGYLLIFTEQSNIWVAVGLFTLQSAVLVYLNVILKNKG
ncbi:hypothetical protein [Lunatibacter salilacus]|uniref:hypothetical protein n=1 Tax=Lunatibacter salilacus TaxID=2483804 RepID=UPI00131DC182|nr:hypothetical protein [Lunatibacter salilacus]